MSEVTRYSAQPFSPNGLMFENEFGHYVLFCEYEKLKAENTRLQDQIAYNINAVKEDMNENSETITKLTRQRDIMKKALETIAGKESEYPELKKYDLILIPFINFARQALQEAEQE